MPVIPALGRRRQVVSVSSRLAWSTKASSRTARTVLKNKNKQTKNRKKKGVWMGSAHFFFGTHGELVLGHSKLRF